MDKINLSRRNDKPVKGKHWYSRDGVPHFGAPMKEVRELGLLPSITEILKIVNDPSLEWWKTFNLIKTAGDNPRVAGMSDKAYQRMVTILANAPSVEAAALGTKIHEEIALLLTGGNWDENDPTLVCFKEWADQHIDHVHWVEKVVVDQELGCAGTCDAFVDLQGTPTILDWKSQGVKNRPKFYQNWVCQLSMYAGTQDPIPAIGSVVVNRTEPQNPHLKIWNDSDRQEAQRAVESAVSLWRYKCKYEPNRNEFK